MVGSRHRAVTGSTTGAMEGALALAAIQAVALLAGPDPPDDPMVGAEVPS
jgi:H+/gluconate symporter-like permease